MTFLLSKHMNRYSFLLDIDFGEQRSFLLGYNLDAVFIRSLSNAVAKKGWIWVKLKKMYEGMKRR